MASLKRIASELGVSFPLVSKVLSGKMGTSRVSARSREMILAKARELNYKPNRLAVALKAGSKATIGIFFHHMGSPGTEMSERLLRGFSQELEKSSYRMLLRFFTTDEDFIAACDEDLINDVDGLIIGGVYHPGLLKNLRALERKNVPIVALFNNEPGRNIRAGVTHVVVNYESQCQLTTGHLIEQGCRRIACFETNQSRTTGFLKAHEEAKLRPDSRLIIPTGSFLRKDGRKSAERLLEKGLPFDGLVCQSDAQANAAINVFLKNGIRIPEDVKVTGIDDSPLAEDCMVPITSASWELHSTGMKTARLLLERIEGKRVKSLTIEPKLVVRRSSGGPEESCDS